MSEGVLPAGVSSERLAHENSHSIPFWKLWHVEVHHREEELALSGIIPRARHRGFVPGGVDLESSSHCLSPWEKYNRHLPTFEIDLTMGPSLTDLLSLSWSDFDQAERALMEACEAAGFGISPDVLVNGWTGRGSKDASTDWDMLG